MTSRQSAQHTFAPVALLSVCLGLAAAVQAGAATPAPPPLRIADIAFEKFVMPNGLTVILHEDHRLPLVAVDVWYHVGPLNERPGRTGFAHLFEHMMFEGSEHVGEKAHFKYVEAAGATDINGTTDFDRTNYFETLPSNQLELGLWLESDRMGFLMEGLDREKLTNQRDVVGNERRQGEGRPYNVVREEIYHQLFPQSHPYYADVIGSHTDIEAARIADVRDFHQQFYTPNNATISIAGDISVPQTKALLVKYFGPIPKGPPVPPVAVKTPMVPKQRRSTVTDTVQLPRVEIGWLTAPLYTQDDSDIYIALTVLGGQKASRLEKTLVYERQIAQDVSCDNQGLKLTGVGTCQVTAKPGVKLEELEAAVWDEVAKLQTRPPTVEEIEAVKAPITTYKVSTLQRLGGFGGVADTLAQYDQYTGDPGFLKADLARGDRSTPETVRVAAQKFLTKESAVVVYCVPGKKVTQDVARSPAETDATVTIKPAYSPAFEQQQSWRKTPPPPGPAPEIHLPVPARFSLANGLTVYLIEEHQLPVLNATLVSRAGSETNPADRPGMAAFTAAMLTEGTEKRVSTEQAQEGQRIGGQLRSFAWMDGAMTSIGVLSNRTADAMDLLADAVESPAFREADVERVRKLRLVGIQQESDNPSAIARRVGPMLIYGNQPYGQPQAGTEASLKAITRADLLGFKTVHYGPRDSALILAGDINEKGAREMADRYFGGWSGTASGPPTLPPAPTAPKQHLVIVDKPGSPQTSLTAWGVGVPADAPDLQAAETMNYTLGGSFGSRINMNLREVHGYTYGAFSYFSEDRGGGPFTAGSMVRTDVTTPAAKELLMELHRIQTTPPTDAELKAAKDASIQSLPGMFATTDGIGWATMSLFLYQRPLDYYAQLPAKLRALTSEDVARAAQTDLHPDQFVLLAVGDRGKIESGLKTLELGPIEYRDALGTPTK